MTRDSRVRPIGVVAIALRSLNAPREVVVGAWAVSAAALAAGLLLLGLAG